MLLQAGRAGRFAERGRRPAVTPSRPAARKGHDLRHATLIARQGGVRPFDDAHHGRKAANGVVVRQPASGAVEASILSQSTSISLLHACFHAGAKACTGGTWADRTRRFEAECASACARPPTRTTRALACGERRRRTPTVCARECAMARGHGALLLFL